jgi:hypothetical protein
MPRFPLLPALVLASLVAGIPAAAEASSTVEVTSHGAVCDGLTDDSAAIEQAAAAVPPGGRLVFPPYAICALLDFVEIRGLIDVLIKGNHATLLGREDMLPKVALMKLYSSTNVRIHDLNFDGNAPAREAISGDETDVIGGTGSNLMFYGADGLDLIRVTTTDAWHDNIYFSKDYGSLPTSIPYMRDVYVSDLLAVGAGRNNLSIIDCRDCVFTDSTLVDAVTANFDIEPNDTSNMVRDVVLKHSTLKNGGASCVHVTQGGGIPVSEVEFEGNLFDGCGSGGLDEPGFGVALGDVEDITIRDNVFRNIDLSAGRNIEEPEKGLHSRSVIDFAKTRRAVVEYNEFEQIDYDDPRESSVFYFFDGPGQDSHSVRRNQMWGLPATTTAGVPAVINWCWVYDKARFRVKAKVNASVMDNRIDGALQMPNPGCN